ncbi:hypothetical protein BRD00_03645 [Halobacteriales archaeon QS_8_69_26]|nr:MAG: hypothetical protein BRD00_03645 [Halobacteriales archaeon QS_8_69_26]
MDPELRRYLDGIFVLLVANGGVNLAGSWSTLTELVFRLVEDGVFGATVYLLIVKSDAEL